MQVKKIIPCLDTRNGIVVKGQKFLQVKDVADPLTLARRYSDEGADELVLYDITASLEGKQIFGELVRNVKNEISIPLTVGGGVNTLADFERLFSYGADKISINSGALKNPQVLKEAADAYGSEKVILSVDVQLADGEYYVFAKGGQENTGIRALAWIQEAEALGVGALVLNSIATDGVKGGFDLPLLKAASSVVSLPIIASGGAGSPADFLTLFQEIPTMAAGLGASVFHFGEISITDLKRYLKEQGIPVMGKDELND